MAITPRMTSTCRIFVVIMLTGCTGGATTVCSAVGYIRTLSVELTGDVTQIRQVRLCDRDGACSGLDGLDPIVSSPGPSGDDIPLYTASGSGNSRSFTMPRPLNPSADADVRRLRPVSLLPVAAVHRSPVGVLLGRGHSGEDCSSLVTDRQHECGVAEPDGPICSAREWQGRRLCTRQNGNSRLS